MLKVQADATPDALVGRLENLVTGRQRGFKSGQELLDSIASDLRECTDQPSGDAPKD